VNEKVNKALLGLIVKTANELAKHHSDRTLKLIGDDVDERFIVHGNNVDDVVGLLDDLDKTQTTFKTEIAELVKQLSDIESSCKDFSLTMGLEATERFGNVHIDIDSLKGAMLELSEIVDSNENINALAVGLKELTEERDNADVLVSETFGNIVADIVKVNESLCHITDDVAGNDEALSDRISGLNKQIDDAIQNISEEIENKNNEQATSFQNILSDIAKFDERVSKLKSSIVGCSEDIASISNGMHAKFDALNDVDVEIEELISGIRCDMEVSSAVITSISECIDKSNEKIAECDKKIKGVSDDLYEELSYVNEHADELAKSLIKYSNDLISLSKSNSLMLESVETISTSLSEQFSELKNESFLSSDKIDTKFAEIRLSLVEGDVIRNELIKKTISEFGEDLQKDLDISFGSYQCDLAERNSEAKLTMVGDVNKMLSADKQMLNRSKQWVPGVEYGQSVIVRNLGGVWQAKCLTADEPTVDSDDWVCVASSFYKVTKLHDHSNGVETIIGIHDSLGNIHRLFIPVPTIRYLNGAYQDLVDYDHLDSIMKDGCRWVATKDKPEKVPGEEGADWQVLTMRGPKGMKGSTGERGPNGKTGARGEKGDPGEIGKTGSRGLSSKSDYIYTKNMLSPAITRKEIDDLIKEPCDGQIVIIHSDIGIERYFRCEYSGTIDKWATLLVDAV